MPVGHVLTPNTSQLNSLIAFLKDPRENNKTNALKFSFFVIASAGTPNLRRIRDYSNLCCEFTVLQTSLKYSFFSISFHGENSFQSPRHKAKNALSACEKICFTHPKIKFLLHIVFHLKVIVSLLLIWHIKVLQPSEE